MDYWTCPICQGKHPECIVECPFGYTDLDQDYEQTQAQKQFLCLILL